MTGALLARASSIDRRYDTVLITEGKDEKAVMKMNIRFGDVVSQETLIGVPREEAIKLLE